MALGFSSQFPQIEVRGGFRRFSGFLIGFRFFFSYFFGFRMFLEGLGAPGGSSEAPGALGGPRRFSMFRRFFVDFSSPTWGNSQVAGTRSTSRSEGARSFLRSARVPFPFSAAGPSGRLGKKGDPLLIYRPLFQRPGCTVTARRPQAQGLASTRARVRAVGLHANRLQMPVSDWTLRDCTLRDCTLGDAHHVR